MKKNKTLMPVVATGGSSGGGGISFVDALPTANLEEYEKHKLYLYNGELYFINERLSNTPYSTELQDVFSEYISNSNLAAVKKDNKAYVISISNNENNYTLYEFDFTTKTITTILDLTDYKNKWRTPNVAIVGNDIYIVGGFNNNYIDKINIDNWNISTNVVSESNLYRSSVVANGTDIYIFGGGNWQASLKNTIKVLDTTSETITTLSVTLPTANGNSPFALVNNKVYLFGGNGSKQSIVIFDLENQTITTSATTLPQDIYEGKGVTFIKDNLVYLFWYASTSYTTNTILEFDTQTETITTLSTTITLTQNSGMYSFAQFDNVLYVFGTNGVNASKNILEFGFEIIYPYNKVTSTEVE